MSHYSCDILNSGNGEKETPTSGLISTLNNISGRDASAFSVDPG